MKPYLEIGPEKNKHTKRERFDDNWHTIGRSGKTNIDQQVEDIEWGIPQKADTFEIVYSSHLIEHLLEPLIFLKDCYKVLKPGGILRINAPSARFYAEQYLKGKMDVDDMVEQLRSYKDDLHQGGFDGPKLKSLFEGAGFIGVIEQEEPDRSISRSMVDRYFSVRPFRSVRVEGYKPMKGAIDAKTHPRRKEEEQEGQTEAPEAHEEKKAPEQEQEVKS